MKRRIRALSFLLSLCLIIPFLLLSVPAEAAGKKSAEEKAREERENRPGRILVGLGDSFAAGEGLGNYGDYTDIEDKLNDENWLAHRSNNSWAGMLRLPDCSGTMQQNRGTNFFFAASSGAVSSNVNQTKYSGTKSGKNIRQEKKIYRKDADVEYTTYMPGQLDVFYDNPALDRNEVDYVTMSIGGNDVNFEKIIQNAATSCRWCSGSTVDMINKELAKLSSTVDKLENTYRRVAEAAPNATIIITGYPPLIAPGGGNSHLFNGGEAKAIADGVTKFNNAIKQRIEELKKKGIKIEYVDVEGAFKGHEAYSSDPWITELDFDTADDLSQGFCAPSSKSIHPNSRGAEAYARLVQQKIDEIEEAKRIRREGADISKKRNIVLVLDKSGSMEGSPIRETKDAAKNFIDKILEEEASVGIVTFSSSAGVRSSFSKDASSLKSTVDGISTDGSTNTSAGLGAAAGMLRACEEGQKIIILMSDGLTNEGLMGAELDQYIESLKSEGINIYTMGYFESLSGSDLKDAQNFMEKSSTSGNHYEVGNSEDIVDTFDDVAEQINGAEYAYARIACPVDVQVSVGEEVLSSTEDITRTSFGTLTFEAGDDEEGSGTDNRVKILRLKENGTKYKIEIRGNGEGSMDYTAGYMDENGEYSDLREIKNVPITEDTYIEANASRKEATILKVDSDGDGSFEKTISKGGPERKKSKSGSRVSEQPRMWWILILAGALLVLAGGAVLFITKKKSPAAMLPVKVQAYPSDSTADESSQSTQGESEYKFCRACGNKLRKSAKFCPSCGYRF